MNGRSAAAALPAAGSGALAEPLPVRINRRDRMDRPTEWLCAQCDRWEKLVTLVVVVQRSGEPARIQLCIDCR